MNFIDWTHFLFIYRIPVFITGVLVGKLLYDKKEILANDYYLKTACLLTVIGVFVVVINKLTVNTGYLFWCGVSLGVYLLIYAGIAILKFLSSKPLASQTLKFFGTISLELYLVHIVFMWSDSLKPYWEQYYVLTLASSIVMSIVISWIIHCLIEKIQKV